MGSLPFLCVYTIFLPYLYPNLTYAHPSVFHPTLYPLITPFAGCIGNQADHASASELLVDVRARLKYPDSALYVLGTLDPSQWSDSLISEYYRLKGSAFFYKGISDSAIVYFTSAMRMVEDEPCNDYYSLGGQRNGGGSTSSPIL